MSTMPLRAQLRAIRRAVAFAQSGKAGSPEHRREEELVSNAVYRAFRQPLIGEYTTPETDQVRLRLIGIVKRISGDDWTKGSTP